MAEDQQAYRQIFKATSIFGGVQVFNILIAIIKSKVIAVLLGPAGMGIQGLLTSTTGLIAGLTNFGLGTSAVKNVAEANGKGDAHRIAVVVSVLRKLVWITGLLGMVATVALSPWLSELTFGNRDYTLAFIWISISLLFNQISSGQLVILQGLRKIKYLANANLTGAVLGLVFSLPFYFFWGMDGIVPAIIATSFVSMIRAWYFARKVAVEKVPVTPAIVKTEGKEMLRMGFMLSLSGLITVAASYAIRIYISNTGGVDDVGLYSAGFAIIGTYVGMIFTAMGTDYYPRLSAIASDNMKAKELINQQAVIAILIIAPILTIFIVFIHWMIILLYSTKFSAVDGMVLWAALGMFFKAASWSIAFIFLAKGVSGLFFWNELSTNIYVLAFNVLGYKYGGLDGLGLSFLVGYFVYLIQVFIVTKIKYQFSFNTAFLKIFLIQLALSIACFLVVKFTASPVNYIVGSGLIIISGLYSLRELNRRMDLRGIVRKQRK